MASWLWPDRVIGKRESRQLREEHNATEERNAELERLLQLSIKALNEVPSFVIPGYAYGTSYCLASEIHKALEKKVRGT